MSGMKWQDCLLSRKRLYAGGKKPQALYILDPKDETISTNSGCSSA